jgi:hypothetical protein
MILKVVKSVCGKCASEKVTTLAYGKVCEECRHFEPETLVDPKKEVLRASLQIMRQKCKDS